MNRGNNQVYGTIQLRLDDLTQGMPGLTQHEGGSLAEAASVCLEEQNHAHEASLRCIGSIRATYTLYRLDVTQQMRNTYNDYDNTTERGACAIAILVITRVADSLVLHRSDKGTGIDYWLGPTDDLLFQSALRLEVSGIRNGDNNQVNARVRQKLKRLRKYNSSLPAYITVVEFSKPLIKVLKHGRNN